MQVVWFKRDLRVKDNRALVQAAARGAVLPLYIIEPELWQQKDLSARQWSFVAETLMELRAELAQLGQPLIVRIGHVLDVLSHLQRAGQLEALWSHEETGNDWTFQRDRAVKAWCKSAGIPWFEIQNHGVQRRLKSRNGWAQSWDGLMAEHQVSPPLLEPNGIELGHIPSATDLGLASDPCPNRQVGGRSAGEQLLSSFLTTRGETYQKDMSSPLEGAQACSRLSPYIAWGALSIREISQATEQQKHRLSKGATQWRKSLRSFSGRLHWHCHFIQKLEDAPRIEFENMHRLYDGLRPSDPDAARLQAWAQGETGYPFLDACMRCLRSTGWLNFRMRAMVMATASYHLWLDWRAPGQQLARYFTDYEPGIHWSQVQMQSGTTGINSIRIYNPVKQGKDQDPTGAFTRHWLPELAQIPDHHLQEPWKADTAGAVLGKIYPEPLFDHLEAAKLAHERIWTVRRNPGFRTQANAILAKHGSRKSRHTGPKGGTRQRKRASSATPAQLQLPFGDK